MQEVLGVVLPFGVIEEGSREKNIEKLVTVVKEERVDKMIVGLPYGADGEETPNTKRVRTFVDDVQKQISINVEFEGEEYSTHEAEAMGGDASLDEKSAMLILEAYLGRQK